MPQNKPPMRRRKVPGPPPPKPPDVAPEPEQPAEPEEPTFKLSGSDPDPSAVEVEDEQPERNEDGTINGNVAAAQTPAANEKRKQSLAVSRALKRMLAMTPRQFEWAQKQPDTMADQIATQLLTSASTGAMDAIKLVYERTEGKVPQALDIDSKAQKAVHERVSEIAVERINALAQSAAGELPEDQDGLDVPSDGDQGPEADGGEPAVEGESA